jgi:cytochrome c553
VSYPVWEVPVLGGGLVIAIISVVHVFIAHFAVGGGLYLALTERKARREGDAALLEYLRRHARFFALLSLVFGATTGVGIWFAIGLVTPVATSALIHLFVWVWAMEYIPFFVEITTLLVYYYAWDVLAPGVHQLVAWLYTVAAWSSLFFINAILTFMLTPGRWLRTGTLWDAFWNPTAVPSLVIRSGVSLALAGLYALVTATRIRPEGLRNRMVRYAAQWLWPAFALIPLGSLWYFSRVPDRSRLLAAPIEIFLALAAVLSLIIFAFSYLGPYREPGRFSTALAALFLTMGFLVTGTSEWVREAIRKPYLITGYLYSNGIRLADEATVRREGILKAAVWSPVRQVTPANTLEAGRQVYLLECSTCHTLRGYNALLPLIAGWPRDYLAQQVDHLETLKGFMPPFLGTAAERDALVAYLLAEEGKKP